MKLLRLSVLILFVLVLAAVLAAPGFIGPRVEETWQQQFGRLRGAETVAFERSWFGAEAQSRLTTQGGVTELSSDIQHGPLLFTSRGPRLGLVYSETRLSIEQLARPLRAQLERLYGRLQHSPVVLESLVGADNRVRNTLRLEPFTRSDSSGELAFTGAEIVVDTDYSGAELRGALEVGSLQRVQGGRALLHTEATSGEFHLVPGTSAELTLLLPRLEADTESGPLQLHDIALQVDTEFLRDGKLRLASELNLPRVESATPVTSVLHRLKLPEVTPEVLGHYFGHLLSALALPPASARNWPQIMVRPLKVEQQLLVESANGPMLMDMDADWRGMRASRRPVKEAPGQWLEPLVGSVTISAAEQALVQSPLIGQVATLRRYGLLLESGDELQMLVEVDRGKLRINGQQLPPDMLIMALMAH